MHLSRLLLLLAHPPLPLLVLNLFHLLGVFTERASELGPHFVGHRDRVAVRGLHLAHAHENAVLVGAHVEEEALVVHSERRAFRQLGRFILHAVVIDKFGERVAELNETLRRQCDGLALRRAQARPPVYRLSDPQEAAALVLLQIHVILPILAHQELALECSPRLVLHRVRVAGPQLRVVLDKVPEEAAFRVLLYVQVEALVLDIDALGRELLCVVLQAGSRARPSCHRVHGAQSRARSRSSLLTSTVSVRHDACLPSPSVCCNLTASQPATRPLSRDFCKETDSNRFIPAMLDPESIWQYWPRGGNAPWMRPTRFHKPVHFANSPTDVFWKWKKTGGIPEKHGENMRHRSDCRPWSCEVATSSTTMLHICSKCVLQEGGKETQKSKLRRPTVNTSASPFRRSKDGTKERVVAWRRMHANLARRTPAV
ncbi:uncharacterized protein LOC132860412 [Tachysurus vachellii]|uniref:uncharacterized protein LOC132860412 n=1 Tax=Tachysurus vachellii TaxID=175792 RepID=UPI00296AD6F3|nr:uncharacterized protein LOC132860412 [Tachysurus vachellii]